MEVEILSEEVVLLAVVVSILKVEGWRIFCKDYSVEEAVVEVRGIQVDHEDNVLDQMQKKELISKPAWTSRSSRPSAEPTSNSATGG